MKKTLLILISLLFLTSSFGEAKTLTYTIGASSDDDIAGSGWHEPLLWLGVDTGTDGFLRFGSRIPKNATITSAYLNLTSSTNQGDTVPVYVKLLDYDNAAAFTVDAWALNVTGSVDWNIPATTADTAYQSSDIGALITSYIGRVGYAYSNYLGLRLVYRSGATKRFYSFDTGTGAQIPNLTVNYTGGDGIVQLWMAEPHNRTKQYVYAQIWNQDAGDKVKFYLDDDLKYTYTVQAGDVPASVGNKFEVSYLFDYTALSAGSHHIDVVLTTSGDSQRGISTKTWTTLHSGYPTVGINEDNSFCLRDIGGTSCTLYFPLFSWMFGADNGSSIEQYPTHAFRTAINGNTHEGYCGSHDIPCQKRYLDANVSAGWLFLGPGRWLDYTPMEGATSYANGITNSTDCGAGDGTGTAITLASCSYVNYFKNHAGLFGYSWGDEPNLWGISVAGQRLYTTNTHAADTNHPVFMSQYGYDYVTTTSAAHPWTYLMGDFTPIADYIGGDYYPYEFGTLTVSGSVITLAGNLSAMDNLYAWNYGLFPFGWFLEPHDEKFPAPRADLGDPTVAQVLNNFWLYVIHGNRSMQYFAPDVPSDYGATTPSATITALTSLKTSLTASTNKLINMILYPQSTKATRQTLNVAATQGIGTVTVNLPWSAATSVGSGGRVDYTVRDYGGKTYVIASRVYLTTESPGWPDDGNTTAVSATFTLTGLSGTKTATRLLTSGTVTVTNGVFSDNFTEYQNEIYEIGDTAGGSTTLGSGGSLSIGAGGTITFGP